MTSCIVEKFKFYTHLSKDEENLLKKLEDKKIEYKQGERIRGKGDGFEDIYIMHSGWAYVSSKLDRGIRSIFDIRMEGDFVGIAELSFDRRLYDFYALEDTVVCPFPKKYLDDVLGKSDNLRDTFFTMLSREQAIAYERMISLGRRTATEKIAHFICELSLRIGMKGMKANKEFLFPMRQEHIADILGMTSVHVSRTMKMLKNNNYIDYDRTSMRIVDPDKLMGLAQFTPEFLLSPKIMDYGDQGNPRD